MVFKNVILCTCLLFLISCGNKSQISHSKDSKQIQSTKEKDITIPDSKIKGLSFVSPHHYLDSLHLIPVTQTGANWIAFSPFGLIEKGKPTVVYNSKMQWVSEKIKGIRRAVIEAQKLNLKIMLKPQLWGPDYFTGDVHFETEKEWDIFEEGYSDYILSFAKLSDSLNVEMFCIGTELAKFVKARPKYWSNLIDEVRQVYTGKITYAENWDAIDACPFWAKLDFIGSDAYYPISHSEQPTKKELIEGWEKWKNNLKTLSKKVNKKILFTEWGYRSCKFNAKRPWHFGRNMEVDLQSQVNAYEVVFENIYTEDWFEGGFLWKWFPDKNAGGEKNDRFTPQNKPGEETLKKYFKIN